MRFNLTVTDEDDGKELRDIMRDRLQMSRTMIKKVKLYGTLEVNGEHRRVIDTVSTGDEVFAAYGEEDEKLKSDPLIPILFEDEYIAVVVKPAGIVTHPCHNHLDDSVLTRLSDNTLHPVMRLDRETSGLMVVAKSGYIHNAMINTKIRKKYVASVYGMYETSEGIIDLPIRRRPNSVMIRETTTPEDPEGKPCITLYRSILENEKDNISLVEFTLLTGRCHQIRVHSTHMGHPLAGDGLYGPNSIDNPCDKFPLSPLLDEKIGRQGLHAYSLTFEHPVSHNEMHFISDIPEDMRRLFPDTSEKVFHELLCKVDGLDAVGSGQES